MPRKTSKQSNAARQTRPYAQIAGWGAVVVVAAVLAVVAFVITRSLSGGDSPSGRPASELDIPSPVAPEPVSRSSAADLLAGKKWDEMSSEEQDAVKTAITRAYANAAFRGTSDAVPAIDVYRIDGTTRASRQYKDAELPDKHATTQRLVFYCDAADGNLDAFGYTILPDKASSERTPFKAHSQPFDALISGLDWSQVKDLGFRTIDGHRTHGFEMPYTPPTTGQVIDSKSWFDVESARIIEREQEGSATYTFDWSVPAPVEIPAGEPVASCADAFYASVPSARPAAAPNATP